MAVGAGCAVHFRTVCAGQQPAAMGAGTGRSRGQEEQTPGRGRGGAQTGGVATSIVGDRRRLPTAAGRANPSSMIRVKEKTLLWAHLPGSQVSGSRCAARHCGGPIAERCSASRVRCAAGQHRRALDSCAPFRGARLATGGSAGNQIQNEVFKRRGQKTQLKPRYG
jgi:hypothetical protein